MADCSALRASACLTSVLHTYVTAEDGCINGVKRHEDTSWCAHNMTGTTLCEHDVLWGSQDNVCVVQLFFESQQEQVTKLLGKEGDLVTALMHNSGTWKLPVAVGAQHGLHSCKCCC